MAGGEHTDAVGGAAKRALHAGRCFAARAALATMHAALLLVAALAFLPSRANAQERLTANDFRIDAVLTPVLASGRITGLAGAFSPLAEGIDGVPFNPAAYAARSAWELRRVEEDLTASLSFPGSFSAADLFLNGQSAGIGVQQGVFFDLGLRIQFGDVGTGFLIQGQSYDIEGIENTTAEFRQGHFGAGYSFYHGQLVIGVGLRLNDFDVAVNAAPVVQFSGVAPEVGLIARFDHLPIRIGVAGRLAVDSRITSPVGGSSDPVRDGGFILPRSIHLPWEVQAGIAWQFGARPFNRRFHLPKDVRRSARERLRDERCERERQQVIREYQEREEIPPPLRCPRLRVRATDREWILAEARWLREARAEMEREIATGEEELATHIRDLYASQPRRYLLVTADATLIGSTENGIGVDAFLAQVRRRRGRNMSLAVRLGFETEPIYNRLKIRVGTYLEPARYTNVPDRLHGTFNFEVHPFSVLGFDLKFGGTIDLARDYFNWGITVGFWH